MVTAFSIDTTAVDVSAASATVGATATFADDLSGVKEGAIESWFQSPSGQRAYAYAVGGSGVLPGIEYYIPRYAEAGVWQPHFVLYDLAGNRREIGPSELSAKGLSASVTVTDSSSDTVPPTLDALTISPGSVNVSSLAQNATVTYSASDALAGGAGAILWWESPSGSQSADLRVISPMALGTGGGGNPTLGITIPRHAEAGIWSPYAYLKDAVGNSRELGPSDLSGFAATLTVTSGTPDVSAPVLSALSFTPAEVAVSDAPATIAVTATYADVGPSGLGADAFDLYFDSPTAGQRVRVAVDGSAGTLSIVVPRYAEGGLWRATAVLKDAIGNTAELDDQALVALGFPATLSVERAFSETVEPGGTLTTDPEGNGASPEIPVQASITTQDGGAVSVVASAETTTEVSGYVIVGTEMVIAAPAGTVEAPLVIVFVLDSSLVPSGGDEHSLDVFRNGEPIPECTGTAGTASPDPCISARARLGDGDVQLTALTSAASTWNFGFSDSPVDPGDDDKGGSSCGCRLPTPMGGDGAPLGAALLAAAAAVIARRRARGVLS